MAVEVWWFDNSFFDATSIVLGVGQKIIAIHADPIYKSCPGQSSCLATFVLLTEKVCKKVQCWAFVAAHHLLQKKGACCAVNFTFCFYEVQTLAPTCSMS